MRKEWPKWNIHNGELEIEKDIKQKFEDVSSEIEEKTKTYYDNTEEGILDGSKIGLPTMEEIKNLNENAERQSINSIKRDKYGVMANIYNEIRNKASDTTNYKQITLLLMVCKKDKEKHEWFLKNSPHIIELFENNGYRFKYNKLSSGNICIYILHLIKMALRWYQRRKYN